MNYLLVNIISCIVIIILIAILLNKNYKAKNDINLCSKCPYRNSMHCWNCKRKFNIKENKYNIVKIDL